nr:hypothetical protein [Tanacetum cinerariifolium]
MPEDPYAYVVAAFQALPPPDYVLGPEEPEQAPPSPVYIPYVPEPVYPEYIPLEDDEPSGDDADEENEEQDEDDDDEEEEEHPASADSIPPPPALRVTARISFRPPIEGHRVDYGFVDSAEAEIRRRRAEDIGY